MSLFTTHFEAQWTLPLLPSNATAWERVVEGVDADLVARDPVFLIEASRSHERAPLALLPYLAGERSVDEFDSGWSEPLRRATVGGSFRYHRKMATRLALALALEPLGYDVAVVEWFEAAGVAVSLPPYTFSLALRLGDEQPWRLDEFPQLIRIANSAKAAHTKLAEINVTRTPPAAVFWPLAVSTMSLVIAIVPTIPDALPVERASLYVAAPVHQAIVIHIRPGA